MSANITIHTRDTISAALASLGEASIPKLSEVTGFSYNTVKAALAVLPVDVSGTYGKVYRLRRQEAAEGTRIRWNNAVKLAGVKRSRNAPLPVDRLELKDPAKVYEASAKFITLKPFIDPTTDPAKLAAQLGIFATLMANLSHDIAAVQNEPDWYLRIGGSNGHLDIPEAV